MRMCLDTCHSLGLNVSSMTLNKHSLTTASGIYDSGSSTSYTLNQRGRERENFLKLYVPQLPYCYYFYGPSIVKADIPDLGSWTLPCDILKTLGTIEVKQNSRLLIIIVKIPQISSRRMMDNQRLVDSLMWFLLLRGLFWGDLPITLHAVSSQTASNSGTEMSVKYLGSVKILSGALTNPLMLD